MKIRLTTQSDKQIWDEYVLNHPNGIAYHLYAWGEAVEKAYGFKSHYFMALRDNKTVGVLPLTIFKLPFGKRRYVSLPYCDAGGPLAETPGIEKELLNQALAIAGKNNFNKLVIRNTRPFAGIEKELTINTKKVRMLLDLPDSSEALMKSFKSKLRSQVKKPIRDHLTIESGGPGLLNDFYPVFAENMRDLGSPVHSKLWIESILTEFHARSRLFLVRMPEGTPAAGGIILCHSRTVSVPWASSLRRFNRFNPNMMLYWGFLEYASDNGYKQFDFGRSTPNEGTFRFKKQWGALPHPLHWADFNCSNPQKTDLIPTGHSGETTGNGHIRKAAEEIITRTPVGFSKILGQLTRKYISL